MSRAWGTLRTTALARLRADGPRGPAPRLFASFSWAAPLLRPGALRPALPPAHAARAGACGRAPLASGAGLLRDTQRTAVSRGLWAAAARAASGVRESCYRTVKMLCSTKRKRRKKINKHKRRKRRKLNRMSTK